MVAPTPLVSVVIPTYDRETLVAEAISSVVAQGRDALEIVVVDDGSRDGTAGRVAALGPPVRLLRQPHVGVAARVRNAGIRAARGQLIGFLDSDDLWLPGKLHRQLAYLAAHPEHLVVYTDMLVVRNGQPGRGTLFDHRPPRLRLPCLDALHNVCVHVSTLLVRREVLERVGLFDEELEMYEVADLVGRISEAYELGVVREPLAVRRREIDGLHLTADDGRRAREARKYLSRYRARRASGTPDESEGAAVHRFEAEIEALEVQLRAG
jgi:glycosyltransferase involved in cell wall biosynthesis